MDTTSTLRPLVEISYDSFTLQSTTPTDLEWTSHSPASEFLSDDTGYEEVEQLAPTLTVATEMAIGFETTNETVSVPNNGKFTLSQPFTKDHLLDDQMTVTFELYGISE